MFVLDTSAPSRARIGWDAMTTPPTPVDSQDVEVDVATETTAERQARFEREALPLLDQLYAAHWRRLLASSTCPRNDSNCAARPSSPVR